MAGKPISVRLEPDLQDQLIRAADEAHMTPGGYLRHALRIHFGTPGVASAAIESNWTIRRMMREQMEWVAKTWGDLVFQRLVEPILAAADEDA